MCVCDGCGVDIETEYEITIDACGKVRLYNLCWYCGGKVVDYIEKGLP